MDDNIELIGRLGQQIVNDSALTRLTWTECAIVLSFAADGFCSGHYGYAYDVDGHAHAFTLDGTAAEATASDYIRWLGQVDGKRVRRMLFQLNVDSGRYALAFERDDPERWQVTPATLDAIVEELRPSLGDEPADVLTVRVGAHTVATVGAFGLPSEVEPHVPLAGPATVEFEDAARTVHRHAVPATEGWLHLSVRVHAGLGCQADAVVTGQPEHAAGVPLGADDVGVRFQPFFLAGANDVPDLTGRGLFARGLHFRGRITPGDIVLSCECDACHRTFLVRSFHAGMGEQAYLYSGSGRHTLIVAGHVAGAPVPLAEPDAAALASLEAALPPAPDGTRFAYRNPFRCPHCAAPYIDFAAHPGEREAEYYGLYFPDTPPIRYDPDARPAPPVSALSRLKKLFR